MQGLGAFALITMGVVIRKFGAARQVIGPMILREIHKSGMRLLPMFLGLSFVLGFLVIGQAASLAHKVGVVDYIGTIMVVVIVRELGPLMTAILLLARVGTANVIELGMARANGEVEALEALGIDPVHYLVVPRVIGMALNTFAMTVYVILGALVSGYLWIFLQDIPMYPGDYFRELARALQGLDFVLLAMKALCFGLLVSLITCYHGLAQPLQMEEISRAAVRTVAQGVLACVLVDAAFIVIYLAAI